MRPCLARRAVSNMPPQLPSSIAPYHRPCAPPRLPKRALTHSALTPLRPSLSMPLDVGNETYPATQRFLVLHFRRGPKQELPNRSLELPPSSDDTTLVSCIVLNCISFRELHRIFAHHHKIWIESFRKFQSASQSGHSLKGPQGISTDLPVAAGSDNIEVRCLNLSESSVQAKRSLVFD